MRTRPLLLTVLVICTLAAIAYGFAGHRRLGSGSRSAATARCCIGCWRAQAGQGGTAGGGGGGGAAGNRPPTPLNWARPRSSRSPTVSPPSAASWPTKPLKWLRILRVASISVTAPDGSPVKKDEELFRLDGALLQAEVKDAEARMALAEATFRRSQTLARSQNVQPPRWTRPAPNWNRRAVRWTWRSNVNAASWCGHLLMGISASASCQKGLCDGRHTAHSNRPDFDALGQPQYS